MFIWNIWLTFVIFKLNSISCFFLPYFWCLLMRYLWGVRLWKKSKITLVRGLESFWWYAYIPFATGSLHWINTYFRLLLALKGDHVPSLCCTWVRSLKKRNTSRLPQPAVCKEGSDIIPKMRRMSAERSKREAQGSICLLWWRDNFCFKFDASTLTDV